MPVRVDPEDSETLALHNCADFTGKRVLEIGCGDGRLTWRYADHATHVIAIDPDAEAVDTAREDLPRHLHDRVEFQVSRLEDFKPPQELFDIALLSWSL